MRVYAEAFDAGHAHTVTKSGTRRANWSPAATASPIGGSLHRQLPIHARAQCVEGSVWRFFSWHLAKWGFHFFDGKLIGPLWASVGCREILRPEIFARTGRSGAPARQDRPLAGRNRLRDRVALAAGIIRAVCYPRPLLITFPSAGFSQSTLGCADAARPVWLQPPSAWIGNRGRRHWVIGIGWRGDWRCDRGRRQAVTPVQPAK